MKRQEQMPEKIYVHKSQYWGLMANETEISNIPCVPSEICDGYIREDFTHVMWYNK